MASVLDGLTPTEYLVMEVLAARYWLGENFWTFPREVIKAVKGLQAGAYVEWKYGSENTLQVWLMGVRRPGTCTRATGQHTPSVAYLG